MLKEEETRLYNYKMLFVGSKIFSNLTLHGLTIILIKFRAYMLDVPCWKCDFISGENHDLLTLKAIWFVIECTEMHNMLNELY